MHSKSNPKTRKKYFAPFLSLFETEVSAQELIENINSYDGYFPDIQWEIQSDKLKLISGNPQLASSNLPERNLKYRKDLLGYLGCKIRTNRFVEGNVYLLSKKIAERLFANKRLYNILNRPADFDYNWVCARYGLSGSLKEVYNEFRVRQLPPRDGYSYDGYIEHAFERITLNVCKRPLLLNKRGQAKHIIINNNLAGGSYKWQKDIEKHIPLVTISTVRALQCFLINSIVPSTVKVILNSFLYTDFTIQNIINLYNKYKFKIIIPIHDWYWLNTETTKEFSHIIHEIYLNLNSEFTKSVINLFDISYRIICPSKFVYDIVTSKYTNTNTVQSAWLDYENQKISKIKVPVGNVINIGALTLAWFSECKGKVLMEYLYKYYHKKKIKINNKIYTINILSIGQNIPYYKDSMYDYIGHIKKYKIHGLLFLNKWGETWCYSLSKALCCGLPILYNNIGAFKERIPTNDDKYIINIDNEQDYHNINKLNINFRQLLKFISKNDIYITECRVYKEVNLDLLSQFGINKKERAIKKYVVYFPQFHEIKENNINFYDRYTDIINLKNLSITSKETPNLAILGLKKIEDYDLSLNDQLISKQIELINEYDIDGFAMYYYWFSTNTVTNRKRVMYDIHRRFVNMDMKGKKLFFIWANENWSDNPAFGKNIHKIINDYSDIEEHCQELIPIFKKNNYLKIDNSPVFYIHHPWYMSTRQINKFRNYMYKLCIENDFNGFDLKINAMNSLQKDILKNKEDYYEFHPNYKQTKTIYKDKDQIKLNYKKYVDEELNFTTSVNTIFFDFDNRARLSIPNRLDQSTICINNTYENHMKYINKIKNSDVQILLINAWNEWGERMHVEPSEQRGNYYLNLIRNNL